MWTGRKGTEEVVADDPASDDAFPTTSSVPLAHRTITRRIQHVERPITNDRISLPDTLHSWVPPGTCHPNNIRLFRLERRQDRLHRPRQRGAGRSHPWLAFLRLDQLGPARHIRLLAKDHQVITLDMPGHGLSDKPTNDEAYGPELVEDVIRLMDHLKIKKAHVVGYSMGGIIAANLLAKHPDRALSARSAAWAGSARGGSSRSSSPQRQGPNSRSAICFRSLAKLALTKRKSSRSTCL